MSIGAIPVVRGCGTRKKNAIYFECGLSPYGQPLEYFIIDPPVLIDDWNLSRVGVQLIERNGITHIIDWVGSEHYPNPADCLEECFPADTRIITRSGVKRIVEIVKDDEVLTHKARYRRVHNTIV